MYRFYSIIPSIQIIKLELFLPRFQHQFKNDFSVTDINYDRDNLDFLMNFTEEYLKTYKQRWKITDDDELISSLKQKFAVILNKYGIITIILNAKEDFAEIEQHFKELCQKIITTLEGLNYKIAKVPTGSTAIPIYISGLDLCPKHLADAIIDQLNKYQKEISNVFGTLVDDLKKGYGNRFHPILEKFKGKNRSYDTLVELQMNVNKFSFFLKMLSITVVRINSSLYAGNNWDMASRNSSSMRELFLEVDKNLEQILRSYSDYIGTSGMFATLAGVGIGIFFVNFTIVNDPIIKSISIFAGIGMMTGSGLFWLRSGIKDLIQKQLNTLLYIIK